MEEKKYLKWYNKIGYGSGDIAGNVVYAFLTSFMMVYLTDSVGLAAGVVGTLIAEKKSRPLKTCNAGYASALLTRLLRGEFTLLPY